MGSKEGKISTVLGVCLSFLVAQVSSETLTTEMDGAVSNLCSVIKDRSQVGGGGVLDMCEIIL